MLPLVSLKLVIRLTAFRIITTQCLPSVIHRMVASPLPDSIAGGIRDKRRV